MLLFIILCMAVIVWISMMFASKIIAIIGKTGQLVITRLMG